MSDSDCAKVRDGQIEQSLPPEQQRVLEMLVMGKTVAATARETGVGRRTVYKWLKSDRLFAAAYSQWQQELSQSANDRMLTLMEKAGDALEKSLDAGDGRLGLRLMEKMGAVKSVEGRQKEAMEVTRKETTASLSFLGRVGKLEGE